MLKSRYLTPYILYDLEDKMVFISGPRQVGKTTLSSELITQKYPRYAYFNWDNKTDRQKIAGSIWPGDVDLIILDEIHKYRKWKQLIKGEYDKLKTTYKFLVTGSARLDVYRKGGDSLQGRYHNFRLHPFTLAELLNVKYSPVKPFDMLNPAGKKTGDELEILNKFGGFPEPLLKQNERFLRRWHNEKTSRLFREDILDMEMIRDLGSMQLLSDILPSKVGSLLSINSLREDLEVSHRAVTHWLNILESFYYHFRVYPYQNKTIRSLKKEPKLYLWDWSEIENEAARFENMIASHLLKWVHFLYDNEGYKAELFYLRNVDKKEVDFMVTIDKNPWFMVEVKLRDTSIASPLKYYLEKLNVPYAYQVVLKKNVDFLTENIRVISADKFLTALI
ncbi:MAG: ATP-binding protein [Candidatus Margulisiibacteriota bacterium]